MYERTSDSFVFVRCNYSIKVIGSDSCLMADYFRVQCIILLFINALVLYVVCYGTYSV